MISLDTKADDETQGSRPYPVELRDVTKRFLSPRGEVFTALQRLNLAVRQGEFCTVVGPTGCGKSTTLGLAAGLDSAYTGDIRVMDSPLIGVNPHAGYVFQADAIFPWKTVLHNVGLGLRYRGHTRKQANSQAMDWIARVGLAGFESYYPYQLSGGMCKRVALAQCLITEPKVLLMDEPFSSLDVQTRTLMEDELLDIWSATSSAVIFITHDLEEAISLGDRVVVLTARPGTVKHSFTIDLPRPRKASEVRFQPEFVEIYRKVWEALRDEVHISYERDLRL